MEEWLLWAAAAMFCLFTLATLWMKKSKLPSYCSFVGCLFIIGALGLRWYTLGRPPWATLYETAAMLALITGLASAYSYRRNYTPAMYVPLAAVTALLLAFSAVSWEANPTLSPLLKNSWLLVHVPVIILSYGLFAVSFAASVAYVALRLLKNGDGHVFKRLDRISFLFTAIGLALLILGVIMGAIWAKAAWGAYWSWDPKETWSLITIIVYSAYLIARRAGMKGENAAFILILGFLAVLFTYFGVSYLIPGLHSYV